MQQGLSVIVILSAIFLTFSQVNAAASGICGGISGQGCPSDKFCDYPIGADCGRTDYPGVCRSKPRVCTQQYDPVCGCDGETYSNICSAYIAGQSIASMGECSTNKPLKKEK